MKTAFHLATALLAILLLASCGGAKTAAAPGSAPLNAANAAHADTQAASFPAGSLQDELQKAGFDVPKSDLASEDFTLDSLAGGRKSLSSYKGRVVILSFWATWCGPCQIEMPAMERLYGRMKSKGLEIVAVDVAEERTTVSSFIKKKGYTFPVLLDTTGEVSGSSLYSAGAIPVNYIIDQRGKVLARVVGVVGPEWDSSERTALFDRLLKTS